MSADCRRHGLVDRRDCLGNLDNFLRSRCGSVGYGACRIDCADTIKVRWYSTFSRRDNLHDGRDHRMNLFRCRCNWCRCDFGACGSDLGRWRGCMGTFRADSRCQGNINGGHSQSSDDSVTTSCSDMLGDWARCDIRADNHGGDRGVLRHGRALGCYNWR